MEKENLRSIIESILFVSGEPIKISRLAKISESSESDVEKIITEISNEYTNQKRGISLTKKEKSVQMVTSSDNAPYVDKLVKSELQESLSPASLEVLSIVAYRGPVTRAAIENIRGVNSSFTLRNLLLRGLLERIGNPKDARGYLYKISFDFLKKMGIDSVDKLPEYDKLAKDERIDSISGGEQS